MTRKKLHAKTRLIAVSYGAIKPRYYVADLHPLSCAQRTENP